MRKTVLAFWIIISMFGSSCSEPQGPSEQITINITEGTSPVFSWSNGSINRLAVFENDSLKWCILSSGTDGISSPVNYGIVPNEADIFIDSINYAVKFDSFGEQLTAGSECQVMITNTEDNSIATKEFIPQRLSLDLQPGINNVSIVHNGLTRELYILLPSDYNDNQEYPVVFFFHGLGGSRDWGREVLSSLLQDEDFIGISAQGMQNSWNAGSGAVPSTADDVDFVLEVIDRLDVSVNTNDDMIYTMGYSNGGAISYRLARDTDRFAAISSMAASHFEGCAVPENAFKTSVLHMHGELDAVVPYNGGQSINLDIVFESAMATVKMWAVHNGLNDDYVTDNTTEDNIIVYRFQDENNPYDVLLYRLEGTTHHMITHEFISSSRCYSVILEFFLNHQKQ
ncbi:alpha/beta hydrolase family esterase [candidate division KSB1 bacterium]